MSKSDKGNILIVDDQVATLKVLTNMLTAQGYRVRQAISGSLALKAAQKAPPDLILLDILMPDMDGYEVCERLKADEGTRDVPIIFISVLEDVQDKVKGFAVGGVDYMSRPFQEEEVLARVETHLALRAMQKQLEEKNAQLEQEVTERKRAEEALRETNVRLNTLIDAIPDVIYFKDARGRNLLVNKAFEKLVGLEKEKILGKTVEQLLPPDLAEQCRGSDEEAINRREPIRIEEQMADDKGEETFFDTIKVPLLDDQENVRGLVGISRHITERKRAEEALRESEEKYRNLVERANDGICIIQDTMIKYLNSRLAEMWGGTVDEVIGTPFANYVQADELPKVVDRYRRRMAGEDVTPIYETVFRRKDGSKVYTELNAGIITYQGMPADLVFVRDITERKRAEEASRESHERFLAVVDGIDADVYVADMETYEILFMNGHMRDSFSDNLVGRICWEVFRGESGPCAHCTNDKLVDADGNPTGLHVWEGHNPITNRWYINHDRAIRWVDGRLVRLQIATDITDRQAAEEVLESVQRAQSLFIRDVDPHVLFDGLLSDILSLTQSEYGFIGEVLWTTEGKPYLKTHAITNIAWNEEMLEFYEINAPEGMEFHNLETLFGAVMTTEKPVISNSPATDSRRGGLPDGHPHLDAFLGLPFHRGDKLVGVMGIANRPGGYDEELAEYLKPLLTTCGSVIEACRNDQQRKRAEEKLREYSERLEEMVEERTNELRDAHEQLVRREKLAVLGQMAGGVSHDLRNPLGAISNAAYYLNLVLEEPDPEVKEMLGIITKEVRRSECVIRSLLDFARTNVPVRCRVNINEVVQEVVSRTTVPENVEVITQLDEGAPIISADPDQLDQIFRNLIRNAVQAMTSANSVEPPEGGQLVVKTEAPDPQWVAISFTDTGAGIPEENLEKLFQPLFTTKAEGVGLGLVIVKTLVEGHGGSIETRSEVGKGSTFTVRLPTGGGPAS